MRFGTRHIADTGFPKIRIEMPEDRVDEVLSHGGTRRLRGVQSAQDKAGVESQKFEAAFERVRDTIIRVERRNANRCHDLGVQSVEQFAVRSTASTPEGEQHRLYRGGNGPLRLEGQLAFHEGGS